MKSLAESYRFLQFQSIRAKLTLAFLAVFAVAVVMGCLGTIGNVLTGFELKQLGQVDLPKVEHATDIERTAAELELLVVSYQSQPGHDPKRVNAIREAADRVETQLRAVETTQLDESFRALVDSIDTSLATHERSAALFFGFDGRNYYLSDFLNFIAVENSTFQKNLTDATRFGVYNGIETDPEQTVFGRWRGTFSTTDEAILELLEQYAVQEAEMLVYVAEKIVGAPENAKAELARMNSRRVPKLDKALKKLSETVALRVAELTSEKETALSSLHKVMDEFVSEVHAQQLRSAADMNKSVEHAVMVGRTMVLVSGVVFLLGLLITVGAMVYAQRQIATPLRGLADILRRLSHREDGIKVPYRERVDEIGEVAKAAEGFRLALVRQQELEVQANIERKAAEAARAAAEETTREVDHARSEVEAERNFHAKKSAVADAFFVAFSRVVQKAEQGQFAERIGVRFDDKDYDALSDAANGMMDSIEESLWKTGQVVGDLAAGRLNTRMTGDFKGAFATLKNDVNATAERLRSVVQSISETSVTVSEDTDSLSQTSEVLSQRSMAQAASIQETNASLIQVTEMISSNVSGAESVALQANEAAGQARTGQQVVQDAAAAMSEIEASGKRVSEIVEVISEISFQTNLLALNAAVEAARAGEDGKGFMVVAQEVRQLAKRAAEAGEDIGELIRQSTVDVEKGVKLVHSAGDVLSGIVQAISGVGAAADEITVSSRDQEISVKEVASVMQHLDRSTQENADAAEHAASLVKRLNKQTGDLEGLLDFFRDQSGQLKDGRNLERPARQSDRDQTAGGDSRTEPYVGASLAARAGENSNSPTGRESRALGAVDLSRQPEKRSA